MSDLIDRQDAINAVKHAWAKGLEPTQYIEALPSAEPERKKGKWIDGMLYQDFDESEWEKVKCSVCKRFIVKQIFYYDNKYHFCPYCGADMRGG